MSATKLTPAQQKEIMSRYTAGELAAPLAREFGVRRMVVTNLLNKHGVEKHTQSYAAFKCIEGTVNEAAFDVITDEAAFWAGFLMIEGYIYNGYVYLEDVPQLKNFRKFMNGTGKITDNIYDFSSNKVIQRLAELGVTELKVLSTTPHPDLADNHHFWRGLLEANQWGSVLVVPEGLAEAFASFASSVGCPSKVTPKGLVCSVRVSPKLKEMLCIQ